MTRVAVIVGGIGAAVLALGLVEDLTNYKWSAGDQNAFFGNPRLLMNDGKSALVAGGVLLVVSAVMWVLATRKGAGDQRRS